MRITLPLNNSFEKIASALIVLVCALILLLQVRAHFVIRTFGNPNLQFETKAFQQIVATSFPQSKLLHSRLANVLLHEGQDFAGALSHAREAIRLSPNDGYLWYQAGIAADALGEMSDAEACLQRATALAPTDSEFQWAYANLLVRQGKLTVSLHPFRVATQLNKELYQLAFETLWQASGKQVNLLGELIGQQPVAQVALAQFLVEQNQPAEAVQFIHQTDVKSLAKLPQIEGLINVLLARQQAPLARELWLRMQLSKLSANVESLESLTENEIWDGGFELNTRRELLQFAWQIKDSDYARLRLDNRTVHKGKQSLQVQLLERDTTRLASELRQRVALQAGSRYRLSGYVKTNELATPSGPMLAIMQGGTVIAATAPFANGTADWQLQSVEFVVPAAADFALALVRTPRFAYDEPARGQFWLDDWQLQRIQ